MKKRRISVMGIILVLLGIATLVMALSRANIIGTLVDEARSDVAVAEYDTLNEAYDGKLVAVAGALTADANLVDDIFGISRRTVMLERVVETYQWTQNCESECVYQMAWREGLVNSATFDADHQNPASQKYASKSFTAKDQKFGAYIIPEALIQKLDYDTVLGPDELTSLYTGSLKVSGEYLTNSSDPANPAFGDYRISYRYVKDKDVTVIAQQSANTFTEFRSSSKETIYEIEAGKDTAEAYINRLAENNRDVNWILVGIGAILVIIGGLIIFNGLKGKK